MSNNTPEAMASNDQLGLYLGYAAVATTTGVGVLVQTSKPTDRKVVAEACAAEWAKVYNSESIRVDVCKLYAQLPNTTDDRL